MEFFIKDFFSKCNQIRSFRRIWVHVRNKSLMENVIFCAMLETHQNSVEKEPSTQSPF